MTEEEKHNTITETNKHRKQVKEYINKFIDDLLDRSYEHDKSKNESPELEIFAEYTPKLKNSIYGSDEYNQWLKEMKVALDHHYENNSHHPEHHTNGINDMTLVDVLEMCCDWKSASLRHENGDILKSIDINEKRFNIDKQLKQILINTVKIYFE
jgi:hypothetical protein